MKTKIIIVIILSIAAAIVIFQILDTDDNKVVLTKQPQTIEEFNITHKEGNELKWDLKSQRAIIGENEKTILLDQTITIRIYAGDEIIVTAGTGAVNREDETVTLKDDVVITMGDYTMSTRSLTWNGNNDIISTHDDIKLEGEKITVTGKGLEALIKEKTVTIKNNVKAQLYN